MLKKGAFAEGVLVPLSLQVLLAPTAAFRTARERGRGFGVLFGYLAVEFVLLYPLEVAVGVARMRSDWLGALAGLWSQYVNFALLPGGLVLAAGFALYYVARWLGWKRLDIWAAASVLTYAWAPHVLMVSVGVVLAGSGAPAVLSPAVVAAPSSPVLSVIKFLGLYGPPLVWTVLAVRAVRVADAIAAVPARKLVVRIAAVVVLALVGTATATAACATARQWQQGRPLFAGDLLPAFRLVDLDGSFLDSASLADRVVILDFWASWCPQCIVAMPRLKSIRHDFSARGVALVSVNVDAGDRAAVRAFVAERQLDFPVYVDAKALEARFHVDALPTLAIVDRHGVIRRVYYGATSERTLRATIEELL